ncbi:MULTISPECIES: MucB/RseB C-terminal domain-containing protein [Pseudidiomarina]|nr:MULTISPECIES: MucB/RseB C-terminal domain-containing protein [Pseudidiomarina]
MIKHAFAVALLSGATLLFMPAAAMEQPNLNSNEDAVTQAENIGQHWFNRMASALRELNFQATLVRSQGQRMQPLQWSHGVLEDGLEVELLQHLNGADVRILRLGNQTSYYFQPSDRSYFVQTDITPGLLPRAFYQSFSHINDHYQVVAVEGHRIVGRMAQYLRLVSRDNYRYHYDLWVDSETGMLLRLQMLTPQREVLEELQLTSIDLPAASPIALQALEGVQRPPRLYHHQQQEPLQFGLYPQWLPSGFSHQAQHHRRLSNTGLATDYFLFSDGLTEVSIYVTDGDSQRLPGLALEGVDSLFNTQTNGYAITVVGKLPVATLQRIGENMALVQPD